jgi:hypothetical protein
MNHEERTIATAALDAGPWANHNQIVIAIADRLKLETKRVEEVLQRLTTRQVLNSIAYRKDSIRYEEGENWRDGE